MTRRNEAKIPRRKAYAAISGPPKGTSTTGQGFFDLPSELRNAVYEYILADAKDMRIRLESGANKKHRVQVTGQEAAPKNDGVLTKDKHSPLSILLTCKQINDEASVMAYSKMSLSLDTVFIRTGPPEDIDQHFADTRISKDRLKDILRTLHKSFRATNLSHVTSMEFLDHKVLRELAIITLYTEISHDRGPDMNCNHMCDQLGTWRGIVHKRFHKVRRITVHAKGVGAHHCIAHKLKEGASWLSALMQPREANSMMAAFCNLEQIVVRRQCGLQQTSYTKEGKIYSPSGMPSGGMDDWLP